MSMLNLFSQTNYKNYIIAAVLGFLGATIMLPLKANDHNDENHDPKYLIEDVIYDVIRAIRRDRERYEDNREEVNKLVKEKIMPHVDVVKMSTLILGRHKRQFTEEQFAEFIHLFESVTIHSYAMYILDYKDSYSLYFRGTRFNTDRGTATVHMILKLEQNRKVDTQFALYYDNDTWKIFNLAFEGINYGLVYRSTYNDIIKNHGIDALLKRMRERLK